MAILKIKDGGVAKSVSVAGNYDYTGLKALVDEISRQFIGSVQWFGRSVVPAKWLLCDGSEVAIADYADLYAAIGDTFGTASAGNFKLPNLIGKFAQGDTTAGVEKEAGLPNITGRAGMNYIVTDGYVPFADYEGAFYRSDESVGSTARRWPNAGSLGDGRHYPHFRFNASRSSSVYGKSTTVQPPAVTLLPCIKALV